MNRTIDVDYDRGGRWVARVDGIRAADFFSMIGAHTWAIALSEPGDLIRLSDCAQLVLAVELGGSGQGRRAA